MPLCRAETPGAEKLGEPKRGEEREAEEVRPSWTGPKDVCLTEFETKHQLWQDRLYSSPQR